MSEPTHDPSPSTSEHALPRRSLLRQAAGLGLAGAGLAVTAGGVALPAAAGATPRRIVIPNPGQLPITGGTDFPIGVFWPPPPYETTVARYQEIKDAGFTFIISGNYADDGYILARGDLAWAQEVGLKVLISDDVMMNNVSKWFTISDDRSVPLSITTGDANVLVQRALSAYDTYTSLAGFNLFDEPAAASFPSLGRAFAITRNLAPNLLVYANLLPGTGPGYDDYVSGFIQTVKPSLLSFDRYPLGTSSDDAGYFQNWAQIRSHALAAGIPSWVFIQTLAYNGHRSPTAAELAWQVNVSLAYGCKGIQYFTYWTPDPARGEGFGTALVTLDGQLTDTYTASKQLNTGWLAPVGRELKQLTSELVQHANESPLPAGAAGFTPDAFVAAASGSPVILGRFTGAIGAGTRVLLVANRSHDATAVTRLTTGTAVSTVQLFDPSTGTYATRPAGYLDVSLAPGAAALYKLS
jgi:hypothetical protein